MTIMLSTRGSADTIISFLVLLTVFLVVRKRYILAGLTFGLSIHFKVYPIMLSLLLYLYISNGKSFFNKDALKFTFWSIFAFGIFTYFFYRKYGWTFLYESTLYHFERKDFKHNFSPSFLFIYLNLDNIKKWHSLMLFLP
jgi:phosphatidylinositol glycan class M